MERKYKLGDLVTLKRGYDLPAAMRREGEYPVVSSSGITGTHNEAKVEYPGVVTGRYGTIGEVFFIDKDFWPLNTSLYVQNFKNNNPRFIYYYLKTVLSANFNAAGAVPGVNRNVLHKLHVPTPPKEQKKIAAILSAYDDLIENKKRRIALLEKMAEEIYREWFVRMRFPGHENVKFQKGVPIEWEITRLNEIVRITMGQSPKSEFYNQTGEGLPFNQGVGTYGKRYPKKAIFCNVAGRKAQKGDVLFSVRAPVGRLNIADCEMIIGRGLAAIRHKEGLNSYLFYLLKTTFSNEDIIGNGAIFNSVGKDELENFKIFKPTRSLDFKFNDIGTKIDVQIASMFQSINRLKRSRDMLLSRLISGKLSVESLDILFPPSMQEEQDAAHA